MQQQQMFFTATATAAGRINLSPKGIDSFRLIDPLTVAYLDLTGSGNETSAHLRVADRITVMFCSFDAKSQILRIYGRGQVIRPRDPDWTAMLQEFPAIDGTRQIVQITVESVQTSCGMGVPRYEFVEQRDSLINWAKNKGSDGLRQYWSEKNQVSIDGLPTEIFSNHNSDTCDR
ncbi:pyridoxamine 5'-phosphate oxidase family protein [Romeriopsis navalis]|uniref:pyridoxamine 5'-phosphate oxidase family protein n=1 Tax=Romeriopsis navalis TaxID=2992132 RepID=UPI0021F8D3A3|nr:pyridoxamine 5'-phosphate oxidase family protein [Romeriopsis navalis]